MHRSYAQVLCILPGGTTDLWAPAFGRATVTAHDPAHRLRPIPVGHRREGPRRGARPTRAGGTGRAGPREPDRRRAPIAIWRAGDRGRDRLGLDGCDVDGPGHRRSRTGSIPRDPAPAPTPGRSGDP